MVPVAIVSVASYTSPEEDQRVDVEALLPVIGEVMAPLGLSPQDMGFTVSGSSDYLAGQAFAFVGALDAVGPWPPIAESHVEMDGAWALYEAWVRLQHGDIDTALVYSFGRSSPGDLPRVLSQQLDPYTMAPLWPDAHSLAALQARAFLERNGSTEADVAGVVARSLAAAEANPQAVRSGRRTVEELLAEPVTFDPLRDHDLPPTTDGATAIVLAAGDRARELCERPAWITGIDHRIEPMQLGLRDLAVSASTRTAARAAGVGEGPVDVAELHAPYAHQELILAEAIGLDGGTAINPSGGALAANPMMAAGLNRFGEVARRIWSGEADRGVAHATAGPCLQQNLVAVLSGPTPEATA